MSELTKPSRQERLQPEEVMRLLDVVRELAAEQEPDGHRYATTKPRQAARAFVAALREDPYLTYRALIFALEEAGHAALLDQSGDAAGGNADG